MTVKFFSRDDGARGKCHVFLFLQFLLLASVAILVYEPRLSVANLIHVLLSLPPLYRSTSLFLRPPFSVPSRRCMGGGGGAWNPRETEDDADGSAAALVIKNSSSRALFFRLGQYFPMNCDVAKTSITCGGGRSRKVSRMNQNCPYSITVAPSPTIC